MDGAVVRTLLAILYIVEKKEVFNLAKINVWNLKKNVYSSSIIGYHGMGTTTMHFVLFLETMQIVEKELLHVLLIILTLSPILMSILQVSKYNLSPAALFGENNSV